MSSDKKHFHTEFDWEKIHLNSKLGKPTTWYQTKTELASIKRVNLDWDCA